MTSRIIFEAKAFISEQPKRPAYEAGRSGVTFRTLYRITNDPSGGHLQLGELYQYPPVACSTPGGNKVYKKAEEQKVAEMAAYPDATFFEVEVTV